jgi:hypothetical protein
MRLQQNLPKMYWAISREMVDENGVNWYVQRRYREQKR